MPDNLQTLDDPIVDFVTGSSGFRLRHSTGKRQPLPRAFGMHIAANGSPETYHIVDATAGLGRDGFLLAATGARVTLIERNRTVHDLLEAALERARLHNHETARIAGRIHLLHADARNWLKSVDCDYVYVDPMHPVRTSSALVRKQLRQVRDIVGDDLDKSELLKTALSVASKRVVLKWPAKSPPISDIPPPSHTIGGKTIRYDVFVRRSE